MAISSYILSILFFILLKPFYLFPSGSIGLADIFLTLTVILVFFAQNKNENEVKLFREDIPFYIFTGFVLLINGLYYLCYGNREFIKYSTYWVYCAAAIWVFRMLYSRSFMKVMVLACGFNIFVQAVVLVSGQGRYFYESWGGSRFMGTFNDPNQFAFFIFTMLLVLFMYYRSGTEYSQGKRILFYFIFTLGLWLIMQSKSTGMFLGLLVFFFILFCQWFYEHMYRSVRRVSWGFAAFCIVILGMGLIWYVWPDADFDISRTSYTLISRIQQKIWKLSNGNLADLLYDRSAERLVLHPEYLLFGAGEGYFERFVPWGFEERLSPGVFHVFHVNEIHSSLFDVWFSYGILPASLLVYWVIRNVAKCDRRQIAAVIALLAESFTLMNLRQPFFWFIIVLAGMSAKTEVKLEGEKVDSCRERIEKCCLR